MPNKQSRSRDVLRQRVSEQFSTYAGGLTQGQLLAHLAPLRGDDKWYILEMLYDLRRAGQVRICPGFPVTYQGTLNNWLARARDRQDDDETEVLQDAAR